VQANMEHAVRVIVLLAVLATIHFLVQHHVSANVLQVLTPMVQRVSIVKQGVIQPLQEKHHVLFALREAFPLLLVQQIIKIVSLALMA